jgi:hypothetical protein
MVSAGFKVSELDVIYANATQDRLSPLRGAGRSQAADPANVQIPPLHFHLRRLEMIIRPLTTAGS